MELVPLACEDGLTLAQKEFVVDMEKIVANDIVFSHDFSQRVVSI